MMSSSLEQLAISQLSDLKWCTSSRFVDGPESSSLGTSDSAGHKSFSVTFEEILFYGLIVSYSGSIMSIVSLDCSP